MTVTDLLHEVDRLKQLLAQGTDLLKLQQNKITILEAKLNVIRKTVNEN
jgi:hypothetical protein